MTAAPPTDTASPAAAPALRRVAIDPLSRVEGHGKVTLLLDENGRVRQARLHIVEFRGFEAFIEGRPYWEVPVVVQRLCGICPVSHHLAAAKALDRVVGASGAHAVTPTADRIRRLMHHGQVMQSHALHFFHLSSPDLLFGFDAEPTRRHIVGVAAAHPEVARQGIGLRRYGQEVIRATAGKRIHGTGAVPGGVNQWVSAVDRQELLAQWPQALAAAQDAVALVRRLHQAAPQLYDGFAAFDSNWLSLVAADGTMDLYDGVLRARDAQGRLIVDGADGQAYEALIEEATEPWTYLKFPYLRQLGAEAGWYRVGPLARVQNCDRIGTPLAEAARQAFLGRRPGVLQGGSLAYHWARMIELLHCVEVIGALLRDEAIVSGERLAGGPRQGGGVGLIEAPRGTLIHHYRVGDDDLVTHCNLIVSTTHNNRAMNEAVRAVADTHLSGHTLTEGLLNHVEVAVRAYDPCLSCATHALGRMPLQLSLRDARGNLLDAVARDGDGQLRRLPGDGTAAAPGAPA